MHIKFVFTNHDSTSTKHGRRRHQTTRALRNIRGIPLYIVEAFPAGIRRCRTRTQSFYILLLARVDAEDLSKDGERVPDETALKYVIMKTSVHFDEKFLNTPENTYSVNTLVQRIVNSRICDAKILKLLYLYLLTEW